MNVAEERRKLSATWLNAIGSGAVVTGFIAPTIAVTLNLTGLAHPDEPRLAHDRLRPTLGRKTRSRRPGAMSVLELYTYFVLPFIVLGIGFGTLWLTRGPDTRAPAE